MDGDWYHSLTLRTGFFFDKCLKERMEISIKNGFWCSSFNDIFCSLIIFHFWRTVPPRTAEEVSPSSVICEMQTLCTLSCHASSDSPFHYSWTKNGQVPVSDDIKIMNNIIVLTPRDAEDYGVYVCHATNSFGSTAYEITLSEGLKAGTIKRDGSAYCQYVTSGACRC